MYEEISERKEKTGKEWRLISVTSFAAIAIVLITGVLICSYLYYGSFRTFTGEFSKTTSVNYRKGSVTVMTAEETFSLTKQNIYYVYSCIVNAGRGRIGNAPEREPDAVLEYEFGGKIELWETEVKNSGSDREYGLFIRFCGMNGYEYAYDTDRLTISRLPLTAKENKE